MREGEKLERRGGGEERKGWTCGQLKVEHARQRAGVCHVVRRGAARGVPAAQRGRASCFGFDSRKRAFLFRIGFLHSNLITSGDYSPRNATTRQCRAHSSSVSTSMRSRVPLSAPSPAHQYLLLATAGGGSSLPRFICPRTLPHDARHT